MFRWRGLVQFEVKARPRRSNTRVRSCEEPSISKTTTWRCSQASGIPAMPLRAFKFYTLSPVTSMRFCPRARQHMLCHHDRSAETLNTEHAFQIKRILREFFALSRKVAKLIADSKQMWHQRRLESQWANL